MSERVDHASTASAIYHIEAIERKARLLRQYINPQAGVVNEMNIVAKLVIDIDNEVADLRADLVKFL